MTLTKTSVVDKIEIVGQYNHIQVRIADYIKDDDAIIASSFSRYVITPGDDISNEPSIIQDIAAVVHTESIIDSYKKHRASELASLPHNENT